MWSCGVILYALLCGSLPFDDENIPNLFKKIKNGVYTLPTHLSPGARHLISRMLLVDPLKRITIPEIRQHPWFAVLLPRYLAVMQARARPLCTRYQPTQHNVSAHAQSACTMRCHVASYQADVQGRAAVLEPSHLAAPLNVRGPATACSTVAQSSQTVVTDSLLAGGAHRTRACRQGHSCAMHCTGVRSRCSHRRRQEPAHHEGERHVLALTHKPHAQPEHEGRLPAAAALRDKPGAAAAAQRHHGADHRRAGQVRLLELILPVLFERRWCLPPCTRLRECHLASCTALHVA